ncbi:MAG: prepilin-type N-terminal cleavage/methylation domain-containing protein [Kiritimatiellae bacterium]|nr:prepilin-type N-terminal cleavage/methylation domain-containing protein [Kiritimatiellia bacterium]
MKEFPSSPNLRNPCGFSARVAQKGGFTLVELLVSTLILVIVATGWFTIMNATSPYREAQRRAAIEVAAGVLDTFFPDPNPQEDDTKVYRTLGYYRLADSATDYPYVYVESDDSRRRFPAHLFPAESPIRYTLRFVCAARRQQRGVLNGNLLPEDDARRLMWERVCDDIYQGGLDDAKNVFVARIRLFDSEKAEKPFAEFEQLVGIAEVHSRDVPKIPGYK